MSAIANGSTIASILSRLDRLEQGGGEALVPTYLTVTPAGLVGADFTGIVSAEGLNIPAGTTGTPPSTNRIRWLRASDGAAVADMTAAEAGTPSFDFVNLSSYAVGGTGSQMVLTAYGSSNLTISQAKLWCYSNPGAGIVQVKAQAYDGSGNNNEAIVIDEQARSSFLQLLSNQQLQLAFGASSVSWPGGSPFSGTTTITYGIGRIAQAVFISPSATSAATLTGMDYTNLTGTTFQVQARTLDGTSPGAGVTAGFSWAALG